MSIAKKAAAAAEELRAESPRARERRLSAEQIAHAIRQHLRIARKAKRDQIGIMVNGEHVPAVTTTVLHAGFVPNSYRYGAASDKVTIIGTSASEVTISAERCSAQSRPNGRGNNLLVRLKKANQNTGVILYAEEL
jgi:hypothetical protein